MSKDYATQLAMHNQLVHGIGAAGVLALIRLLQAKNHARKRRQSPVAFKDVDNDGARSSGLSGGDGSERSCWRGKDAQENTKRCDEACCNFVFQRDRKHLTNPTW